MQCSSQGLYFVIFTETYRPGRFLRARRDVSTPEDMEEEEFEEESYSLPFEVAQLSDIIGDTKCQVLTNDTVICDEDVS